MRTHVHGSCSVQTLAAQSEALEGYLPTALPVQVTPTEGKPTTEETPDQSGHAARFSAHAKPFVPRTVPKSSTWTNQDVGQRAASVQRVGDCGGCASFLVECLLQ